MSHRLSKRAFLKTIVVTGLAPGQTLFQPVTTLISPAEEKGLVFLFQGDSITDGNRGRNTDPNHIMGHGYAFAIASRIGADFPENDFTFYNRGISGNRVPDLQKRWQTDTLALKPNVLSILIGVNDTAFSIDKPAEAPGLDAFETGYRDILTQSKQQNPDTLFVLGLPFVYPVGKRAENWELWRDAVAKRQDVVRKLAQEFDAVVVDYPAALDKGIRQKSADYWIWDGIHPTIFGHELMAREWIKQVRSRLRFLKKYR
ncbi:SGNH/GDSL hydrolase family protein [Spirosoma soli]|uniref:SGNH/GDSL hydrolase family protein n=1 Tax=Spirosoma soli TaxID=1770529 RepID=A0ABW5M6N8_9BACT